MPLRKIHPIDKDTPLYQCPECPKIFTETASFRLHKQTHSKDYPYKCDRCSYKCKVKKYLSRHNKKVHSKPNGPQCGVCGKVFHFSSSLRNHMRVHTGEKPFKCKDCGKAFASTYCLSMHKLIHTNEKPFECSFCDYACRDTSTLRRHQERHMGIYKTYPCVKCKKTFKSGTAMRLHIDEEHYGLDTRIHRCNQCEKTFKTNSNLRMHVKVVHELAMRTECEICGRIFSKNNFMQHLRTHIDVRPYKCSFRKCNKRFKDASSLKKHSIIHYPELQYKCDLCDRRFKRKHRLTEHRRQHQGGRFTCDYCGISSESKKFLSLHIRKTHGLNPERYICDQCDVVTYSRRAILMHLRYGHGTKFDTYCKICNTIVKDCYVLVEHYIKMHNVKYVIINDDENDNINIKDEPMEVSAEFDFRYDVQKVEIDDSYPCTEATSNNETQQDVISSIEQAEIMDVEKSEIHIEYADTETTLQYSRQVFAEDISRSIADRDGSQPESTFDAFYVKQVLKEPRRKVYPRQIVDKEKVAESNRELQILMNENNLRKETSVLKRMREEYNRRISMTTSSIGKKKIDSTKIKYFKMQENPQKEEECSDENDDYSQNDEINENYETESINYKNECIEIEIQDNFNEYLESESRNNDDEIEIKHRIENENIKIDDTIKLPNGINDIAKSALEENDNNTIEQQHTENDNIVLQNNNNKEIEQDKIEDNCNVQLSNNQIENNDTLIQEDTSQDKNNENHEENNQSENNDTMKQDTRNKEKNTSLNENSETKINQIDNIPKENSLQLNINEEEPQTNNNNDIKDNINTDELSISRRLRTRKVKLSNKDETECKVKKDVNKNGKIKFFGHECYICFKLFKTKDLLKDHCKEHFDVGNEKMLRKCPLCGFVSDKGIKKHMKSTHNINTKLYGTVHEKNSKYIFKTSNGSEIDVIPSISNLNKIAAMKMDKKNRENNNLFLGKTKLVRKGKGWVVEKEAVNLTKEYLLPEFSDEEYLKIKITGESYLDRMKKLGFLARKRGLKILYPCDGCEKICVTLAALKLHHRHHEENPKRYKPKVWVNRHIEYTSKRSILSRKKFAKENKKKKPVRHIPIDGTGKDFEEFSFLSGTGTQKSTDTENRFLSPKPVKNKHKCDKNLIKFYETNIKGGDIEFWQFLKIFNKMSRENVNDFDDLENRNDLHFGLHCNTQPSNDTENIDKEQPNTSQKPLVTDKRLSKPINGQKNGHSSFEKPVNTGNVNKPKNNKKVNKKQFTRAIMISRKEYLRRNEIKQQMRKKIQESHIITAH